MIISCKNKGINSIPIENQFLGVQNFDQLQTMKIHELFALRVVAHRSRAVTMKNRGFDLRFVAYENLVKNQFNELKSVFSQCEMSKLGKFQLVAESNFSSLQKFKEVSSSEEICEIHNIETRFRRYDSD